MDVQRVQSSIGTALAVVCGLSHGVATRAFGQVSGNATTTSDYVWRGSSQTRHQPAVQGGLTYAHTSGFHISSWGSNVNFGPANNAHSEFDVGLGWGREVAKNWTIGIDWQRYWYQSADASINWSEVNASLNLGTTKWLIVGHSNNALASGTTGTYAAIGVRYPPIQRLRVEGSVARYFLDEAYADSYTHGSVGVVWTIKPPLDFRLTLHGTDQAAKRLFPGMAGSRAEFAVQASW